MEVYRKYDRQGNLVQSGTFELICDECEHRREHYRIVIDGGTVKTLCTTCVIDRVGKRAAPQTANCAQGAALKATFHGQTVVVKTWREGLGTLLAMLARHNNDAVTKLAATFPRYIATGKGGMYEPKSLSGTPYYYEAHLTSKRIVSLVGRFAKAAGLSKNSMFLEAK